MPAALLPMYALARLVGMPDEVLLGDALNRAIGGGSAFSPLLGRGQRRSERSALAAIVLAAAALLLAVSTAFHAAGLLVDPYSPRSHNAVLQPDTHPETLWRWSDFPPLYNLRVRLRR